MRVFVWLVLLSSFLWAQTPGRKTVEGYYEGLSLAAELKFAEGMTAHRSSDYQGLDEEGRRSDKWSDLNRFRALFAQSLAVRCQSKIQQFSEQGDKIVCTVTQEWTITQKLETVPKTRVELETRVVEDTWIRKSADWELSRSTVKSHSLPTWKT